MFISRKLPWSLCVLLGVAFAGIASADEVLRLTNDDLPPLPPPDGNVSYSDGSSPAGLPEKPDKLTFTNADLTSETLHRAEDMSFSDGQGPPPDPGADTRLRFGDGDLEGPPLNGHRTFTVSLPDGAVLEMVSIPPGSFKMGSLGEPEWDQVNIAEPSREVRLRHEFALGRTEVTQAQWLSIMGDWPGNRPREHQGMGPNFPAYNVSWQNAQEYIDALNAHVEQTGQIQPLFRLPSEAEWEYAAREGSDRRFPFSQSTCKPNDCDFLCLLGDYAWYCQNSLEKAQPVAGRLPNAFGLHDMNGNVWELCADSYRMGYGDQPANGRPYVDAEYRNYVMRGGSYFDPPVACGGTYRQLATPSFRSLGIGFRLAWGETP